MNFILEFSSLSDGWLKFQLDDVAKGIATQMQIVASMRSEPQKARYSSFTVEFDETWTF